MRGRVIHISLDGLTTPLGHSQVLAVSERLHSLGWECTILSLEPASSDESVLRRLQRRVASTGIQWRHRPYRSGRAGAIANVLSMISMIRELRETPDLYHCRSYFGAAFPAAIDVFRDRPYIFDTRGYWVDEKIEAGRWFQDAATRAVARRVERALYQRAEGVVTLTELAAEDARNGRFGKRYSRERAVCIPTCVDYAKFTMDRREPPHELLREGPVLAYVGSLNPSYEYHASLRLAASALERIPSAKFLALTAQVDAMRALCDDFSIPKARRLIRSVAHEEIHSWFPWIDFALMLLVPPNQAKRASMPTKLGEFLATGVAPVSHGGNSEVADWVERTGSGFVLPDLSDASFERAVERITGGRPDPSVCLRARNMAEKHFSLGSGAARYDGLFQEVLG